MGNLYRCLTLALKNVDLDDLQEILDAREIKMKTFCPECGPDVDIDEDGLCLTCGATAIGAAVVALSQFITKLELKIKRSDRRITELEAELNHLRGVTK